MDNKEMRLEAVIDSTITKGNASILMVDDEDFILDAASIMLSQCGYKVFMCRNGDEAVSFYMDNWKKIDLVILDMIMPVMDGKTCFLKLQTINPDIKVILSSGYSINGKAQELLDQGVTGFIQKPYRMSTLTKKINEVLKTEAK
jgi:DNA-binding NtrC family response regulator